MFSPSHQADVLANATLPISSLLASAFTSGAAADGGMQMAGSGPDSRSKHAFTAASFTSTLFALKHVSHSWCRYSARTLLGHAATTALASDSRYSAAAGQL